MPLAERETLNRNNVTIQSNEDSTSKKIPKLDRTDAKRYDDVFFDTEEGGSTGGGSPQDPTKKNPWEPPDFD